jgi:hypothetical protein
MTLWRGYENLKESIEMLYAFLKFVGKSKDLSQPAINLDLTLKTVLEPLIS